MCVCASFGGEFALMRNAAAAGKTMVTKRASWLAGFLSLAFLRFAASSSCVCLASVSDR